VNRAHSLLLYLRSRRVAVTLAVGVAATAALWALAIELDRFDVHRILGLYAVVACIAAAGHGLAGPDTGLDRTAAVDWRPRRATHILLVIAVTLGIAAATALTGRTLGSLGEIARNSVGSGGLLALAAATIGATHAWIPAVVWAALAPRLLYDLWPSPDPSGLAEVVTWPVQAAASTPAAVTAVILGVVGAAAYTLRGPRP
jgi:hypothetical protein